ncbi:MAG: type II toxin-antitoxin system RelE family toxin [Sciscionella sp.]
MSRYTIVLARSAQRDLHKLPLKVGHACLEFLEGAVAENPYRVGKPLESSWEGHYTARRAEYRIIYTIDDHRVIVEVVAIAHRAHAYRPR